MSSGTLSSFDTLRPIEPATSSRRRRLFRARENLLLVIPLGAMLLLPVVEILLRTIFRSGISVSSAIVQHLTLIVGMLGGAITARDGRLLALSPVLTLLKGRAKAAARIFSSGFAAATSFFLFLASFQYVLAAKPLGKILVYMGFRFGSSNCSCR
jgi:C4-dicarboxylate transporter, DctM subunit